MTTNNYSKGFKADLVRENINYELDITERTYEVYLQDKNTLSNDLKLFWRHNVKFDYNITPSTLDKKLDKFVDKAYKKWEGEGWYYMKIIVNSKLPKWQNLPPIVKSKHGYFETYMWTLYVDDVK